MSFYPWCISQTIVRHVLRIWCNIRNVYYCTEARLRTQWNGRKGPFHYYVTQRFFSQFWPPVTKCRTGPTPSGVAMGCAGCAMHKGPQPSEGPQESEGLLQSEGPSAIWSAKNDLRAPSIWGALSNPRGSSNLRGPSNLHERPSAIWRASDNLRGPIYLRGPQQSEGPQQSIWELLSFRSSFRPMLSTRSTIFEIAQLLFDYYALSSTFSDVCCRWRCQWLLRHSNNHFRNWNTSKILRSTMSEKRLSDLEIE